MARSIVAVIPGDDAAPEAMAAAMGVLGQLDVPVDWDVLPPGAELSRLDATDREAFVHEHIDAADTVLFGSTNGTTPGVAHMRWGRRTYANVRPIRWRPGYRSPLAQPEGIDYLIVRENLEDAYVGIMGDAAALHRAGLVGPKARLAYEGEGRYAAKVITRAGTEAVARFAFALARRRRAAGHPGKLTVSAKTNMLPKTDRWFCDIVREVGQDHPDVELDQYIVDDMAHRLVLRPHELDVLLLPNLYGDVLSDEGAATIGGMGLAPSGCYGDDFAYFESAHGTAPDIAGQGRINPTATLLSAVLLLEHLGLGDAARRLDEAVTRVYAEGSVLPVDQGGAAGTEAFADAVAAALA
ncbi:MAG: isocitrate/isopropylmalate dehydrogenase family protein [Acidimicrobiia bacterium]|nr:isocitrate/isopropylmalate dehydrogenase family protein [Acidimicrobiia bacterium]